MNVFATTSALLLASLPAVLAHGNIVDPAAVWTAGYAMNGYISEVNNTIWGEQDGSVYGYGGEGTIKYFKANYPDSGYTTLKDLILANQDMYEDTIDKQCGYTILDEAKRADMPATEITFSGFTHPGPCELWCDDNKLAFDYDCQTTYASGKVPVDASKCSGANRFRIFWLALHSAPWQVYTNCVYLTGGTASGSNSTSTTTTTTPTPTTATPVADDADADSASAATSTTSSADDEPTASTDSSATTDSSVSTDASASATDDETVTDAPVTSASGSDEYAITDVPAATAASTPSPTKKCTVKTRRA
uniref:Chitin-binding type-4 domain-containing protein n=1 Tax=Globisporangium ultimum (strain ATCC 200006 / CBS 805.95 / DAOM BR144) TaxID=431595 RepID=K3WN75_GLOUD